MDKAAGKTTASQFLYPQIDPFDQRMLSVGDGHRVYVEQCGNPDGVPVIVLHGGPGGGCSPAMRRYFDPTHYRIVLFDQRGCGRSRPHASVEANTTWHLVRDIERIREEFGIDRWVVFGGSWGATLALIYALTHPERAAHLVLRGVFLMTRAELDWFYGGGAGQFWPDMWARFVDPIPHDERDDLIAAYARRLFSGDHAIETRFARAWASWENTLASIMNDGPGGDSPVGIRPCLRPARESLFHECRLSRGRRLDPAQHGPDPPHPWHHRAGPLRHDLPAVWCLPTARGLAWIAPVPCAACRPRAERAGDQRRACAHHGPPAERGLRGRR